MRRLIIAAGLLLTTALRVDAQSAAAACAPSATERQVARTFGDLRVCMLAFGGDSDAGPREWAVTARQVVLETQRDNDRRRLMVFGDSIEWAVNGQSKAPDSASQAWRVQVIALLDVAWEAEQLRTTVAFLRMNIDSAPARRARLQADLDGLDGRLKHYRELPDRVRAQDRALRKQIADARAQISTLNAQLAAARLPTVRSDAARAQAEGLAASIESSIRYEQNQIAELERKLTALDADKRIAAVERALAGLDRDEIAADLKAQLASLDTAALTGLREELRIAEDRVRSLDEATAAALARLRKLLP